MKLHNATMALALAMIGLFGAVSPGFSANGTNAVSTVSLNVRSGPSTRYNVVDVLYPGERVRVTGCLQRWCYIEHPGPDGWVAARYLDRSAPPPPAYTPLPPPPFPPRVDPQDPWPGPPIPWPFHPWPGNTSVPPNQPHAHPWPAPAQPEYQICVFNGPNYTGRQSCILSERYFERLGGFWNDRISSIQVFPGARVTVCTDTEFRGRCRTFARSTPVLNGWLNNKISSLKVH